MRELVGKGQYEKVSVSMRQDQIAEVRLIAIVEKHHNLSRVMQDLIDEALATRRARQSSDLVERLEAVAS